MEATMETPTAPDHRSDLRWLYDAYVQTQKLRIAIGNRIGAVERAADDAPLSRSIEKLFLDLRDGERAIFGDMEDALVGHPAMPWLGRVKGIGPTLATKMLALIGDVSTFTTVSKLWRFAGYAVIDGHRERPVKGEKLHYCAPLKTTMYLVAGSFLKAKSPYEQLYRNARERYAARELAKPKAEQWPDGRQHLTAIRVMNKVFLQHLWLTWRQALDLPTRSLYVEERLGHTTIIDPWAMVKEE